MASKRKYTYYMHVKRPCRGMICVIIVLTMLFAGSSTCLAAEEAPVRVAVIDYPNYIQMGEDGAVSGYVYEYLQDIKKYTGWRYEFIEMTFTEATEALAKGDIDLLAGNQYTAERAKFYDYSKRDMGEGGSVLCVMPDDSRYCYNDYASYDGMKIASMTGSVRIEQTKEKLARYGTTAEFVLFDSDKESKEALKRGDVDAVLMSTIRCENNYKILARLSTAPLYFCINKQRPQLKEQLDAAMEEIHLQSPYYEEKLDEKYYSAIPVQLSFTQEEKEYIASCGTIKVAVASDLMPTEYYSKDSNDYRGVVPDSFKRIEEYSGLHFNFVERTDMDSMREQMNSGQIQMIASIADDRYVQELWGVDLSDSYYSNSLSIIINDKVNDYKDVECSVVIRKGYPFLEKFAREQGYINITFVDSFTECVEMVEDAKTDITLIPSDCVDSIIHSHYYSHINSFLLPGSYMEFCIGLSPDQNPLLFSIINKSIASITKEQRTAILVQNLTAADESLSFKDFFLAHRVTIMALALAIAGVIIAGALYFAISRQRLNNKLKVALDKADAASRAKTEFLARMSHDMRTPMNGILGLCYLMEKNAETPEMKKELAQLHETGKYLLQLINDALDVNKMEIGQIELHPRVCDEEKLFDSIIELMAPQLENRKINFTFTKKDIQWKYMMVDEQRVKQIFINLLSNAMKFTPDGGRIDFIMELVSEDEHMVRDRFIIRDNGIGITEEFLPNLFEPFSQENRMDKGSEGTGLGLYIVKNLVELMGGTINVSSEVNKGTEFTIFLNFPITTCTEGENEYRDIDLPAGIRILLCEDHPLNAKVTMRLLQHQGAEVIWRENGQLGADTFYQSEPGYFDVILMDIRMPVMDGLEATRKIRSMNRPDAEKVIIIAMTANAYDEDINKSMEVGMNAHLAKPVIPSDLYATIAKYLLD